MTITINPRFIALAITLAIAIGAIASIATGSSSVVRHAQGVTTDRIAAIGE